MNTRYAHDDVAELGVVGDGGDVHVVDVECNVRVDEPVCSDMAHTYMMAASYSSVRLAASTLLSPA